LYQGILLAFYDSKIDSETDQQHCLNIHTIAQEYALNALETL